MAIAKHLIILKKIIVAPTMFHQTKGGYTIVLGK
jgi:hypothetical protein